MVFKKSNHSVKPLNKIILRITIFRQPKSGLQLQINKNIQERLSNMEKM